MDTEHRLGLIAVYAVMGIYALLIVGTLVQILLKAAIERHRRRRFTERNSKEAYPATRFDGKRGWANTWLPRNPEIIQLAQDGNSAGKVAGAAPIVNQAIALVSIVIALGLAGTVAAQQRSGGEVRASTLRQQLLDLESNETQVSMRLEELDYQLKPESIERELAGIGSTRPEELREHRRKLLTIERNGLQKQLNLLEEDRARIEAAIAEAESTAESPNAQPSPAPLPVTTPRKPITEMSSLRYLRNAELPLQKFIVAVATLVLLGTGFILILIVARQKVQQ